MTSLRQVALLHTEFTYAFPITISHVTPAYHFYGFTSFQHATLPQHLALQNVIW
jgi:hypothetical protein